MTVTLGPSQRVSLPDLVLSKAAGRATIAGVVRDAQGRPMEGVRIWLRQLTGRDTYPAVGRATTAAGEFRIAAATGATYQVSAEVGTGANLAEISSAPFELRGDHIIELTFKDR